MQPIVFNKAGKLMLTKFENGKPASLDPGKCFFRNGVVQQIQPSISINGTPIPDGNSLWDATNLDTGIEGSFAVQLAYMPAELYAFIMGDTSEKNKTVDFPYVDAEFTIPDTAPYEIKLPHTPTSDGVMIVDIHNTAFEAVEGAGTVAKGKFKLVTDTLTFHEDDAGTPIYLSFFTSRSGVEQFGLPKNPVRSAYQLVIVGEAVGEDDTLYETAITVDRSKVLGSINLPTQGGTPQPITVTFNILKPRGDLRAVDIKAAPIK